LGGDLLEAPRIVWHDFRRLSTVLYLSLGCAFEEAGPERGAGVCLALIEDLLPQFERETGNRSYRRAVLGLRARVAAWGGNATRLPSLREYPAAPTSGILTALLRLDASIPMGHQTDRWRYHYTEIATYLAQDWALARSAEDTRADALQRNPNAIEAYYQKRMLAAELLDREIADAQSARHTRA